MKLEHATYARHHAPPGVALRHNRLHVNRTQKA